MSQSTNGFHLDSSLLDRSLDCVHCGLCLSACPTYRITGRENSSPRGRVYLIRGAAEGKIEVGDLMAEELGLCLGCRACESECPSGVEFGAMLEKGREAVAESGRLGSLDMVEVNPSLKPGEPADTTVQLGTRLVEAMLGARTTAGRGVQARTGGAGGPASVWRRCWRTRGSPGPAGTSPCSSRLTGPATTPGSSGSGRRCSASRA